MVHICAIRLIAVKAQAGAEYDLFVLQSLKKDTVAGPPESVPVYAAKATDTDSDVMSEVDKMKFNSKFNKDPTRTDKIEMQLK